MQEITANPVMSGIFKPEFLSNPFPMYAALREGPPAQVTFPNGQRFWLVSRYQDVLAVLKDRRFTTDYARCVDPETIPEALRLKDSIIIMDGEDHARLRRLASQAFTPRFVENLRPRIQQIADELIDTVQDAGRMDLVRDFALPLPMKVILEMLGVPTEDRERCRIGSNAIIASFDRTRGAPSEETMRLVTEFRDYIRTLVEAKRTNPGDDLLSGFIQAHEQGDKLSENEMLGLVRTLIVAGHETTVSLIGVGMLELLTHRDELERLRATPEQIPAAVEELLRLASVASATGPRYATEDIELGGQLIRRSEALLPLVAAANHDPALFEQPEQFDEARSESRHLSFGHGAHYCLGAPLARLEGQIALATLLRRLPNLRLSESPDAVAWGGTWLLRGLKQLLVEF